MMADMLPVALPADSIYLAWARAIVKDVNQLWGDHANLPPITIDLSIYTGRAEEARVRSSFVAELAQRAEALDLNNPKDLLAANAIMACWGSIESRHSGWTH